MVYYNKYNRKRGKMMNFKKLRGRFLMGVVILAIVVLFSSYVGAAAKNDAIGYVDMQRLQNELPDFLKLQEIAKDKTSELNYFRGYLFSQQQSAAKELEKKATADKAGKSADQQAAIDKQLQDDNSKKISDVNAQIQKKYDELQQYMNDQKEAALNRVKKIIADVAEEKKVTLVLEKSLCFYGGTDITQAVIDKAKKDAVNSAAAKDGTNSTKK
jgi:Skp family chaperone for outer membrane proteins